nr:MAG TPA: hypothetical protein [Caudoviricetes sp.]
MRPKRTTAVKYSLLINHANFAFFVCKSPDKNKRTPIAVERTQVAALQARS